MSVQATNLKMELNKIVSQKENGANGIRETDQFLKKDTQQAQLEKRKTDLENNTGNTSIKDMENANKKIFGNNKEFKFSMHEETKQIMIKVIDKATQEVIKEFPSEKILDMVASMCEASGLFIDETR